MRIRRAQPRRETCWKYAIFFSLLTLFWAVALPAQQKNLSQEKRVAIEKAVASFMAANSVPGLSAAVVLDGEPRWSDDRDQPNRPTLRTVEGHRHVRFELPRPARQQGLLRSGFR